MLVQFENEDKPDHLLSSKLSTKIYARNLTIYFYGEVDSTCNDK
jgi:hypothetical protein